VAFNGLGSQRPRALRRVRRHVHELLHMPLGRLAVTATDRITPQETRLISQPTSGMRHATTDRHGRCWKVRGSDRLAAFGQVARSYSRTDRNRTRNAWCRLLWRHPTLGTLGAEQFVGRIRSILPTWVCPILTNREALDHWNAEPPPRCREATVLPCRRHQPVDPPHVQSPKGDHETDQILGFL